MAALGFWVAIGPPLYGLSEKFGLTLYFRYKPCTLVSL